MNIDQVAEQASEHIGRMIKEQSTEIADAMTTLLSESQESGKKGALSLAFSIKIATDSNKVTYRLSFSEKHTSEIEDEVDDPNQKKLPGVEDER